MASAKVKKDGSRTRRQSRVGIGTGVQQESKRDRVSYAFFREMRKHPTIALARALSMAPIIAGEWSIETNNNADDRAVELVERDIMPIRRQFMRAAISGCYDFGWSPFEKVFERDESGLLTLRKLKPLLQDITHINIDAETGAFVGFRQYSEDLPVEYSLLINMGVEGSYLYGQGYLENCRKDYVRWKNISDGAERYDNKVAGTHWIIYYPIGTSPDPDNPSTDSSTWLTNAEVADKILASLEASGSVSLPRAVVEYFDEIKDMGKDFEERLGWKIELLGDNPKQFSFNARLEYEDKMFVRGYGMPERAIIEGRFGTKAEAGVHQDLAVTNMDLMHQDVTAQVNRYLINPLLEYNFGRRAKDTVCLEAAPLVNSKLAFLQEVFKALLTGQTTAIEIMNRLDVSALFDLVGVTQVPEDDFSENEDDNDALIEGLYREANQEAQETDDA